MLLFLSAIEIQIANQILGFSLRLQALARYFAYSVDNGVGLRSRPVHEGGLPAAQQPRHRCVAGAVLESGQSRKGSWP